MGFYDFFQTIFKSDRKGMYFNGGCDSAIDAVACHQTILLSFLQCRNTWHSINNVPSI